MPREGDRRATSWGDCLEENLEAFGAIPRNGKEQKWVAFGAVVKDGRDWITAARNADKTHGGFERGAEAFDKAWRNADLRQSNVQRQHEASLFCTVVTCVILFAFLTSYIFVFFLRYTIGQSGMGPALVLFLFLGS